MIDGNFYAYQGTLILNKTGSANALAQLSWQTATILYVGNMYGGRGDDVVQLGSGHGTDQLANGVRVEVQGAGKLALNGKTEALATTGGWVLHLYTTYSTSALITGGRKPFADAAVGRWAVAVAVAAVIIAVAVGTTMGAVIAMAVTLAAAASGANRLTRGANTLEKVITIIIPNITITGPTPPTSM